MKFSHTDPKELPPQVDILFMGRRRVTRKFTLGANNSIGDAIYKAYGAADPAEITSATTGFANLRLVQQVVQPSQNPMVPSTLVQVFETLTDELSQEVSDNIDYDLNGLKRTTRQLIGSNAADTSAFVLGSQTFGTSPVQYLANVKIDANEAFTRVNAIYLQAGVTNRSSRLLDGGLKEVTVHSFHTINAASPGIIVNQTEENELGYPIWSSTTLQKYDGTDPAVGTAESHGVLMNFQYPGVASFLFGPRGTYAGLTYWIGDVSLSPPIEALVQSTVSVSYTTSTSIPTLSPALWNPTSWATLYSYWVSSGIEPTSKYEGLRGYRVGAVSTMSYAPIYDKASFFGRYVYGLAEATLSGGPPNPSGNSYTLSYVIAPAFIGTDGTRYYRHTQVVAAIP